MRLMTGDSPTEPRSSGATLPIVGFLFFTAIPACPFFPPKISSRISRIFGLQLSRTACGGTDYPDGNAVSDDEAGSRKSQEALDREDTATNP